MASFEESDNLYKQHPIFFKPKPKIKRSDCVWLYKTPVERNKFVDNAKILAEDVESFKGKQITNKIGRALGITRMEMENLPKEKKMAITSYHDHVIYGVTAVRMRFQSVEQHRGSSLAR